MYLVSEPTVVVPAKSMRTCDPLPFVGLMEASHPATQSQSAAHVVPKPRPPLVHVDPSPKSSSKQCRSAVEVSQHAWLPVPAFTRAANTEKAMVVISGRIL